MYFFKRQSIFVVAAMMLIVIEAAPRPGAEWDRHNNPCVFDEEKIEICQRCAKQTKSPIVYPMCCNSEDNVYEWCDKYIHYGKLP